MIEENEASLNPHDLLKTIQEAISEAGLYKRTR